MDTVRNKIHSTAIIEPTVELAGNVEVGPYAVLKGHVKVGSGTVIKERVSIEGYTTIGENNTIFANAVIGSQTQDKKFDGRISYVRIGNNNNIREFVTVNPGTEEGTETVIGDNNLLMAYAHVAHDCRVMNNVTMANVATLAGHVVVEDRAIIGGLSAVHQFVRIGRMSIIGGCTKVVQDIPPYLMADGHPAKAFGINSVGLDRNNVSKEAKQELKRAYKIIFRSKLTLKSAIHEIRATLTLCPELEVLLAFLETTERGICD